MASAQPKNKPPPPKESDVESEEGSETSDEETEDEEQAEGGSDFESESEKSTDTTKKKLTSILPTKQQSAVKPSAPGTEGKRTREANGKKDKDDEPPTKKKKPESAMPAAKSAAKPTGPQPDKKRESATKTRPAAAKEKATKEADAKKSTKKKPQSPAAKSETPRASKSSASDGETPHKSAAKPARPWQPDEEISLSKEIQKDRVDDLYGANLPSARADPYWEKLISRLPFMDKYDEENRVERLCEKVRRMRLRYDHLLMRLKGGETNVWKNDHEGKLWRIWHTIWGPNKATPGMLNGDGDEEDESEEESEEEESEEEEEEEVKIEQTQAKGRQPAAAGPAAQKKATASKKKAQSSSDDESDKGSPVKVTPPAVLAAPGKTIASASKSGHVKDPAPSAMEVDVAPRAVVHNGASIVVSSDELRAENLAFLRDMRGTCVKMVEEAKTQSLLISERMLEETRAKTTEIVEEARAKSSQIMEELRMVVERLGSVAGQSAPRANSSPPVNYSENPFQGNLLLGNGVLGGEQSELEGRWREQSEAEQGLLLQRLQLVQEQARVQQEGIRLNLTKINRQKQQQQQQSKSSQEKA